MDTRLNILVKREPLIFYCQGFGVIRKMIRPKGVRITIDGDPRMTMELKARKDPYRIRLAPGEHMLEAEDLQVDLKKKDDALGKGLIGGVFGLLLGGMSGGGLGAIAGMASGAEGGMGFGSRYKECQMVLDLMDGDRVSIQARCTTKGDVKMKVLNPSGSGRSSGRSGRSSSSGRSGAPARQRR